MTSDKPQGRGRDIRTAMVEAGKAQLGTKGVDPSGALDITQALDDADVARGSAFGKNRAWQYQRDYQFDVLQDVVEQFPSPELTNSFDELTYAVLDKELTTPEGRREGLDLLVHHPAIFSQLLKDSREWLLWNAIWSCVISTPTTADDVAIGTPAERSYERAEEVLGKHYGAILGFLGFTPKTDTADAVLAGIVLDLILGAATTPKTTKPDDMAAAIHALIAAFYTSKRPIAGI